MATKRPSPTHTTPGMVRSAIRGKLWLRSPERRDALKREGYTCQRCGAKQSTAKGREVKVDAHHRNGIRKQAWDLAIGIIIKYIIQTPDDIEILCKECHKKEHHADK